MYTILKIKKTGLKKSKKSKLEEKRTMRGTIEREKDLYGNAVKYLFELDTDELFIDGIENSEEEIISSLEEAKEFQRILNIWSEDEPEIPSDLLESTMLRIDSSFSEDDNPTESAII